MTWTKISDDHFDREEIFSLSRSAALLDIEAKIWCNRIGNDGHVPAALLARLTTSPDPEADASELVAGDVWEVEGNGWQVDWSDQRTKIDVDASRAANKAKQAAYRDRVKRHGDGDHSACHPNFCPALSNPKLTGSVTGLVSPPDLTCPVPDPDLTCPGPKGQGTGSGLSGAGGSAHAATASPRRELDPQGQDKPAQLESHYWQDDGSGISCDACGLPLVHNCHRVNQFQASA